MKVKVLKYLKHLDSYRCENLDGGGGHEYIDFHMFGLTPAPENRADLVGKIINISSVHTYIWIASRFEEVKE